MLKTAEEMEGEGRNTNNMDATIRCYMSTLPNFSLALS